jgi:hypothetical protein
MVLHLHGQPLDARLGRQAFRHSPTLEDAVLLQPEVEVVCPSVMLMNDEA